MDVKGSYLKNESGQVISPVVNTQTIYGNNGKLLIDLIYPVGSIFMSTSSTNPGTYLPNTTWTAWGSGRVPVGINTSDDDFKTVEKTGGEKKHTMTIDELVSHTHTDGTNTDGINAPAGNVSATVSYDSWKGRATSATGGSQPFNILQPYITCYMFKRTK